MIEIKCEHLASVEGPNGTRHHVVFNPISETVKAVREWKESNEKHGIRVEDRAGIHVREIPASVVKTTYDYNTLVITTDR